MSITIRFWKICLSLLGFEKSIGAQTYNPQLFKKILQFYSNVAVVLPAVCIFHEKLAFVKGSFVIS